MNTKLRESFERDLDAEPPYDLAERAMRGARTRRRNRFVVAGAVIATAAVVLGVVVGTGQLRSDVEPQPSDVAAIPSVLPSPKGIPYLAAGKVERASAAYVVDGELLLVDAATGNVAREVYGWIAPDGAASNIAARVTDVALSPDGRKAVVTTHFHMRPYTTVRVIDIATDMESVADDLVPADDAGGDTLVRPSVYAWENDSTHFICSCAVKGGAPELIRVAADGTWETTGPGEISPLQVAVGTAGVAAQIEANGGPWPMSPDFDPTGVTVPASYAAALSRDDLPTYIAFRGSGFTTGVVGGPERFSGPLPSSGFASQYVVATDVDAVGGGFVAVVAVARRAENFADPSDAADPSKAVLSREAVFISSDGISSDGAYQDFVTVPSDAIAVSFASDLVAP